MVWFCSSMCFGTRVVWDFWWVCDPMIETESLLKLTPLGNSNDKSNKYWILSFFPLVLVLFVYEVCLSCSILIWLSGFKVFCSFLVCISFLDIEIEVSSLVFLLNNIAKPMIHIICEHPLNFGCNLCNSIRVWNCK